MIALLLVDLMSDKKKVVIKALEHISKVKNNILLVGGVMNIVAAMEKWYTESYNQ